ncbi:MAG TPA: hypothetical protein VGO67_12395 [Verrucomicrobiae bacterium]|jgi:hypothetical protein
MNPETNDPSKITENILSAVRSQKRKGRVMVVAALLLGILAIVASIVMAWANVALIMPMDRLLVEDYQSVTLKAKTNPEGKEILSPEQLNLRHAQVTAAQGTSIILADVSVALLAVGTLVILLLVNFNRRVTLRQINESLAQISNQITDLQQRQGPGLK